jgi:hypothetical protein
MRLEAESYWPPETAARRRLALWARDTPDEQIGSGTFIAKQEHEWASC